MSNERDYQVEFGEVLLDEEGVFWNNGQWVFHTAAFPTEVNATERVPRGARYRMRLQLELIEPCPEIEVEDRF